jgi:hypothetical protein
VFYHRPFMVKHLDENKCYVLTFIVVVLGQFTLGKERMTVEG